MVRSFREGDADGRRAAVRTRKDRSNPVGTNSRRDGIHDSDSENKPRQAHKQTGLSRAADRRREMRTDLQFGQLRHRKMPPLVPRSDRVTSKTVLCDDSTFCEPWLSTANNGLANKLRERVGPACPRELRINRAPRADGAAPIADADPSAPSRGVLAGQTLK